MTGLYLEKLRALKSQKGAVRALPKLTKRSPTVEKAQRATADGGFGSFDSALLRAPSSFPARYGRVAAVLEARCPDLVPADRWQLAVDDGRRLLASWGEQAEALGWTARTCSAFTSRRRCRTRATAACPAMTRPASSGCYRAGTVVALTEATAAIQSSTGAITIYRRHNKPALGS